MFTEWRRRRAVQRVKPGDGRPLKGFRWWQLLVRALFHLRLTNDDGRQTVYAVDVRHWQNQASGGVEAHLYLDRRQHAKSRLPAVFPVQGGTIEVRMSAFGLKRCHYVTEEGTERQLVPDPCSAEGRRARLDSAHPALGRTIGVLSTVVLVTAVVLLVPQLIEQVTRPAAISQHIGSFTSPLDLPGWANTAIGLSTLVASTERALRLRYSRLLDGAAG